MNSLTKPFVVLCALFLNSMYLCAQNINSHTELQKLLTELDNIPNTAPVTTVIPIIEKIKGLSGPLTTELLALQESGVDHILADDYFINKSDKKYVNNRTIRDTQFVIATVIIAEAMLRVGKKELADGVSFQNEWANEEQFILKIFSKMQIPDDVNIWSEFLKEWRSEVIRVNSKDFRMALLQAAYSLLRLGAGIEKQHIDIVRKRIAQGTGTLGSASATVTYSSGGYYPSHMYHRHNRVMLRIQRHYGRP